jgi:hypothetical protein
MLKQSEIGWKTKILYIEVNLEFFLNIPTGNRPNIEYTYDDSKSGFQIVSKS